MPQILVTGAQGFLASRILSLHPDWAGLSHAQFDLTDPAQMRQVTEQLHPRVIVHCAALADTAYCGAHPDESRLVNLEGPAALAEICRQTGCKLVFMSSDQVYNGCHGPEAFGEDIPLDPQNVYGVHKLAAEHAIAQLLPDAVLLRLTWMFDLPVRGKKCNSNLIWNIVRALCTQEPIRLATREYRGMTDIWEVAGAMEQILSLPGGVYNCGSENERSTYEIACAVFETMRIPPGVQSALLLRNTEWSRNLKIRNEKIAAYGIHFSKTRDAVRRCVEAYGFQF